MADAWTTQRGKSLRMACCGALALWAGDCAMAQMPCRYEIAAVIQAPDCPFHPNATTGYGISPNGRYVCGVYGQCDLYSEAWVYDMQTREFFTIPRPPGILGAFAADVSDTGLVCGTADTANAPGGFQGFMFDIATQIWTHLPAQNSNGWSGATGVNNKGQVCGWRSIDDGGDPVNPQTAFVWNGTFRDLGIVNGYGTFGADINEMGTATGTMAVDQTNHPFLWRDDGTLIDLGTLSGLGTQSLAITDDERVAGWAQITAPPTAQTRGFVWHQGRMFNIGVLPGFDRSYALDVNGVGMAVGVCEVVSGDAVAPIVWFRKQVFDLQKMISSKSLVLRQAEAIAENGLICVQAQSDGEAIVTALLVPISVTGDANSDCRVNVDDLLLVIVDWGEHESPADVNHDHVVNVLDLVMVIQSWTPN